MYKILIVDDETIFREYLRDRIDWSYYGFELSGEARNGLEALEKISQTVPDVILLDINMPFMDGLALTEQLKEKYNEIFIVLITGHSEFEYARKAVKLGVEDFILKPFDKEELIMALLKIKENLQKRKNAGIADKNNTMFEMEKTPDALPGKMTRSRKIVEKAKEYIKNNYTDSELSVEMIAGNLYINSSYLRKVFNKELNMSVTDFITGIRMQRAKDLISTGNIKFSGISEAVGYSNASYFGKCFKKHFGMTPSEYDNINK